MYLRHRLSFEALGFLFGVSNDTAHRSFHRMQKLCKERVIDRLLFLEPPGVVKQFIPPDFAEAFEDTFFIVDGLPKDVLQPENFLLNKLTWSVYKHANIVHFVFGKRYERGLCEDIMNSNKTGSLGISPDGRFQFRTALHGGNTPEVTTMFNTSGIAKALSGKDVPIQLLRCIWNHADLPDLGYPDVVTSNDGIAYMLGDGAYSRASLSEKVQVKYPSGRYDDGPQLKVTPLRNASHFLFHIHFHSPLHNRPSH